MHPKVSSPPACRCWCVRSVIVVVFYIVLCSVITGAHVDEWIQTAACRSHCITTTMAEVPEHVLCDNEPDCRKCWDTCETAQVNVRQCVRPFIYMFCTQNPGCLAACEAVNSPISTTNTNMTHEFVSKPTVTIHENKSFTCTWEKPERITSLPPDANVTMETDIVYVLLWKDIMQTNDWHLALMTPNTTVHLSPISGTHEHFNFMVMAVTRSSGRIATSGTIVPNMHHRSTTTHAPPTVTPPGSGSGGGGPGGGAPSGVLELPSGSGSMDIPAGMDPDVLNALIPMGKDTQSMSWAEMYPLRPKSDEQHISASDIPLYQEIQRQEKLNFTVTNHFVPAITTSVHHGVVNVAATWDREQTAILREYVGKGLILIMHWGREGCYGNFLNPRCHFDLNSHWFTRLEAKFKGTETTVSVALEQLMYNSVYWLQVKAGSTKSDAIRILTPACYHSVSAMERCNDTLHDQPDVMMYKATPPTQQKLIPLLRESAFKLVPVIVLALCIAFIFSLTFLYIMRRVTSRKNKQHRKDIELQDTDLYNEIELQDCPKRRVSGSLCIYDEQVIPVKYDLPPPMDTQSVAEDQSSGISSYATQTAAEICLPAATELSQRGIERRHSMADCTDECGLPTPDVKLPNISKSCANFQDSNATLKPGKWDEITNDGPDRMHGGSTYRLDDYKHLAEGSISSLLSGTMDNVSEGSIGDAQETSSRVYSVEDISLYDNVNEQMSDDKGDCQDAQSRC